MANCIENQPLTSIIIVTRNRPDYLKNCLKLLNQQSYSNFEIIVVDSSDETNQFIEKSYPKIKYIRYHQGKNMAISRNIGILNSIGEIVVFIDDDCFVEKDWVKEIAKSFNEPQIGGVGGRVIQENVSLYTDDPSQVGRITPNGLLLGFFDYDGQESFTVDYLVGCNMSFRREILEKLGGFDPIFSVWNDVDMSMRVRNLGYSLIFNPKAKLVHKMVRRDLLPRERATFTSQYVYKRNYAYVLFKNSEFKWRYFKTLFYWDVINLFKNISFLKSFPLIVANLSGKFMGIILALKIKILGEKDYLYV